MMGISIKGKAFGALVTMLMPCCVLMGCGDAAPSTDAGRGLRSEAVSETVMETAGRGESASEHEAQADVTEEAAAEDVGAESTAVEGAAAGETDYEACYAPVLEEVAAFVVDGYEDAREYAYISSGLIEKCMYSGGDELSEVIGYALLDISGDGIPELIIGCDEDYGGERPQSYIYSVFTLVSGEPIDVIEGWARNSYRWMGDGHFYYLGSGGVSSTYFGECHLKPDGSEIEWDDLYFTEETEYGELGLYHNTTGFPDAVASEELEISEAQFFGVMDDYEAECETLSWMPMASLIF